MRLLIFLLLLGPLTQAFAEKPFPKEAKFPGLEGGEITAAEFAGHYTVVQFFGSWCTSCKHNFLTAAKAAERHHAKFVPISLDSSLPLAKSFFKTSPDVIKPFEKQSYLDKNGEIAKKLGVGGPSILVLDSEGRIVHIATGHLGGTDLAQLEAALRP